MAVGDAYVFPGFFTPVLTQLFLPKPPTTFLTCFCRGERRKHAGKKVASTGDRTRNHQVMSPTRSSLSHPGGVRASESQKNEMFIFYFILFIKNEIRAVLSKNICVAFSLLFSIDNQSAHSVAKAVRD